MITTPLWEPFELTLTAPVESIRMIDPHGSVSTWLTFVDTTGKTKVRVTSGVSGKHTFSQPLEETTLFFKQSTEQNNSLYLHGKLLHGQHSRWLQHADGSNFFWLSDTWWYAMTARITTDEFTLLVKKRRSQGFTAALVVVGQTPEVSVNSPATANEGGTPWLNSQPNADYLAIVDERIRIMVQNEIVPVIVGSWSYALDELGESTIKTWWRELVARYTAYPVVFCVCGELGIVPPPNYFADLSNNRKLKSSFHRLPTRLTSFVKKMYKKVNQHTVAHRIEAWQKISIQIREWDPNTPITVHAHSAAPVSSFFSSSDWLSLDTNQTGHDLQSKNALGKLSQRHQKDIPYLNLEPWYEGINGKINAAHIEQAFWESIQSGETGYAYGAQGLWNFSARNNPFLTHWGNANWQEAMELPGAEIIAVSKKQLLKKGLLSAQDVLQ